MVAPEIKILAVTLLAEGANVSCCFHFWSSGTFVMPLTERGGRTCLWRCLAFTLKSCIDQLTFFN